MVIIDLNTQNYDLESIILARKQTFKIFESSDNSQ
jgi:hypothetical protein